MNSEQVESERSYDKFLKLVLRDSRERLVDGIQPTVKYISPCRTMRLNSRVKFLSDSLKALAHTFARSDPLSIVDRFADIR